MKSKKSKSETEFFSDKKILLGLFNICKSFGNTKALQDISFQLKKGECLVILGPSGAGKTTTLKVISGLEYPDEGLVVLNNKLINQLEPKERNMSMVFETYALYPNVSVFENIASPLKALKTNKQEIKEKVQTITKMLGIFPYLDRKPGNLSGGQRQRVALGRALAKPADLYLMDEPIAHLDAKLRYQMIGEFKHLIEKLNISLLYVTHDWREAMSLGTNIVVLNNGNIEQYADKNGIYNKPNNTFVSQIVGDPPMNLINGDIVKRDGKTYFESNGINLSLINDLESCKAKLGIRPSKIKIEKTDVNGLKGEIYASGKQGLKTIISIKIGDEIHKTEYRGSNNFEMGSSVPLKIDQEGACIFDNNNRLIHVIGE